MSTDVIIVGINSLNLFRWMQMLRIVQIAVTKIFQSWYLRLLVLPLLVIPVHQDHVKGVVNNDRQKVQK